MINRLRFSLDWGQILNLSPMRHKPEGCPYIKFPLDPLCDLCVLCGLLKREVKLCLKKRNE